MNASSTTQKTRVPAVEGLFVMDDDNPRLIGGKGVSRESYFFPKDLAGNDPGCIGDEIEEVLLTNRGTVWSYTNSGYQPPPPYINQTEPYEPFVVAAVQLPENLVILGQMVAGTSLDEMSVGMEVELTLDTLYEDDDHEYVMWKWQPASQVGADQ